MFYLANILGPHWLQTPPNPILLLNNTILHGYATRNPADSQSKIKPQLELCFTMFPNFVKPRVVVP
jgi:hypothetical protein